MTNSFSAESSGEYAFPGSRLKAELLQEAIAITDFMNTNGGYMSGSIGAVDPLAVIKGEAGNCFAATVLIVEELKKYHERQEYLEPDEYFIGFTSDHGKEQVDGRKKASHTTLFAVDPQSLTVVEANIMAYSNIPPRVVIEPELTKVLQDLGTSDLTVVNSDVDFVENYALNKEGNSVSFMIEAYEQAIHTYLSRLGKLGIFSLSEVRSALNSSRHRIPNGLVKDPSRPIDMPSGKELNFDEDF